MAPPRVTASKPMPDDPQQPRDPDSRSRRGRPLSGGMKTMMKFAISYNTAYYGVDPDKIVAYA